MGGFREERDDLGWPNECKGGRRNTRAYGHTTVSTNDGNADRRGKRNVSKLLSGKGRGTNNVQGGDAEEPETGSRLVSRIHVIKRGGPIIPLRIENTMLFEDFGDNWNGRIHRVGNYKNECFGTGLCDPDCEITNDARITLENW